MHTKDNFSTAGFAHPPSTIDELGIEPGMKVADFGSGSGVYTLLIAQALEKSGSVYAVDIQRDLLRRTHNEAVRMGLQGVVHTLWGDLEAPGGSKIGDKGCDLVLVSNVLFQLPDKAAVFVEARRVLKSTGRLAIIDWSDSYGGMGPVKDDVVTKDAALHAAEKAGFKIVREFPAGAHHYGLIFRRRVDQEEKRGV
jgi:ubiquinone/menaquinone biosynthesis C-methylase UbiE